MALPRRLGTRLACLALTEHAAPRKEPSSRGAGLAAFCPSPQTPSPKRVSLTHECREMPWHGDLLSPESRQTCVYRAHSLA